MIHISLDRSRCTSATCIRRWRCARYNDVNYGSEVMLSYTNFAELCNDNENPFSYFIDWLGGMELAAMAGLNNIPCMSVKWTK